ncbi:MAG: hypothetical protein AB7K24_19085, partial [Gemmataceae bacterium]
DPILGLPKVTYPTGQSSRGYEDSQDIVTIPADMNGLIIDTYYATFPGEQTRIVLEAGSSGLYSSYGMNNRANVFGGGDENKVLLIEYRKTTANLVGPSGNDSWNAMVAERHYSGLANVLLVDGSVQTYRVADIDPTKKPNYIQYWLPFVDN